MNAEKQNLKKNKIIHIITRMDMGGSAQNTLQTCIGLAHKYNTILVCGPTHESEMSAAERKQVYKQVEEAKGRGIRFVIVPSLIRAIQPIADVTALHTIYRLLKYEKPEIVHTHTSKAGLLGRWGAKIAGVPHVVHTPHGHVFHGHFSGLLSYAFRILEKITSLITEKIIALTNGERKDYLRYAVAKEKQLDTIHSGVDIQRFMNNVQNDGAEKTKDGLGLDKGTIVVGTVGWLLPIKGPMHLFNALKLVWQKFPNVNLVYVGQGEEGTRIRHEADRLGFTNRIHFLGWRDDVENLLPLLNIFVLPSLNEGMGRVIVEAMAAGLPVVASDTGGIPDLVVHGKTGFLFPPGDERALADSIVRLIEDPDLAKRMGDAGRERCHRFSLQSMLDKLDRLYQEVLTTEISENTEI